ncbi:hypothetical protein BASA61_000085 [Batrachochytrium salamandrivorans]|nr:hypothetical protein BASA61_000085 [Batrachochytrium salamandrivorans]
MTDTGASKFEISVDLDDVQAEDMLIDEDPSIRIKSNASKRKGRGFRDNDNQELDQGGFEALDVDHSGRAQKSVEGWVVLVTNVHEEATEEDVMERFAEFGTVKNLHLNLDRRTGFVKGYALIEYQQYQEAKAAVEVADGSDLLGQILRADFAFVRGASDSKTCALLTSPRVDRQAAVADHFVIRTSIRAEDQGQPPVPRAPTLSRHHCLEATDRIATSNYWDVLADGAADNTDTDTDTDIHQLTSQFLESANAVADNLSLRLSPPATRSNRRLLSGTTKRAILASNTARQAFIAAATIPNPDPVQCNTLRDEWSRLKAAATQLERVDGRKQWVKHADNLDRAVSDGRTDLVFSAARAMSGNSSRSAAVTPLYNSSGIVQYDPTSILRVMQGHYGSLAADTTGHSLDLQYWHNRQPIQVSRDTPPI